MHPVSGVFNTRADAERAIDNLKSENITSELVNLLTPASSEAAFDAVPTMDTEEPGIGEAMGGVVGGAIGAAGGMGLGAAAASIFVPGVGHLIAIGLFSAALFGTAGVVGGSMAGKALDDSMEEGLPIDDMFVYEDALRKGRSVVIILADTSGKADAARGIMELAGAESIDSARETWWLGLRDDEEMHYAPDADNLELGESNYRRGFEAALRPQTRGKSYVEAINYLIAFFPRVYSEDAFRRGYEHGQAHYRKLMEKHGASAG